MEQVDFRMLCPECKIMMTQRARHCYICNMCVDRFDHHCDWLDGCIGSKNHKIFFFFILSLFIFQILILCIAVDQIIFKRGEEDTSDHPFEFFDKGFYNIWVA